MQPFQLTEWTTFPTDDELVNAIVGTGGSELDRRRAEAVVRDLMLPTLRTLEPLAFLQSELGFLRDSYASWEFHDVSDPVARLVRVGMRVELSRISYCAMLLSQVRLRDALWPGQPFPEEWEGAAELEAFASTADLVAAATTLERRLAEITERYGIHGRGDRRSAELIANSIAVAKTGDYSVTSGPVRELLTTRGVPTSGVPGEFPL